MWTDTTRRQHSRAGLRYPSDLRDAEWGLIRSLLPPPPPSCLDSPTFEAARFHQFQTMMMTVSLRCKSHGMDVETSFSRM